MSLTASLRRNWRGCLICVTPIALSSLLFTSGSQISKCTFMMGICTVYWVTEALPLPVTSLLPVVMAPMLGVLTSDEVCGIFFSDLAMLVIGAVFVASAVEESNLHRRIALRLMLLIGVQPKRFLLSIVSITGFLSMWIANIVATSTMSPIVQTLIAKQLEARRSIAAALGTKSNSDVTDTEPETEEPKTLSNIDGDNAIKTMDKHNSDGLKDEGDELMMKNDIEDGEWKDMRKIFNLAVCYSANIGGIGTLLGTPPNLVLAKTVGDFAHDGIGPITYASWMKFGVPTCLFSLTIAYLWMSVSVFGFKNTILCKRTTNKREDRLLRNVLLEEYARLGSMSFHEKVVLGHFVIWLLLCFTRDPGFIAGWASFFPKKYVKDSIPAILILCSLFVWPKHRPTCSPTPQETAINWKRAALKFPWGVLLLFGGGYTLAQASKTSGLSDVLVDYLSFVSTLPPWLTVLILTTLTCVLTEITTNTVITIITLPILGNLAMKFQVDPLLYMLPVTAAASMAFMLPVATPPNAVVYAHGDVKMTDMIKTGFAMNILGIIAINLVINTVGYWAFSLDTVPSWVLHLDDVTGNGTGQPMINSTILNTFDNATIATNESTFIMQLGT